MWVHADVARSRASAAPRPGARIAPRPAATSAARSCPSPRPPRAAGGCGHAQRRRVGGPPLLRRPGAVLDGGRPRGRRTARLLEPHALPRLRGGPPAHDPPPYSHAGDAPYPASIDTPLVPGVAARLVDLGCRSAQGAVCRKSTSGFPFSTGWALPAQSVPGSRATLPAVRGNPRRRVGPGRAAPAGRPLAGPRDRARPRASGVVRAGERFWQDTRRGRDACGRGGQAWRRDRPVLGTATPSAAAAASRPASRLRPPPPTSCRLRRLLVIALKQQGLDPATVDAVWSPTPREHFGGLPFLLLDARRPPHAAAAAGRAAGPRRAPVQRWRCCSGLAEARRTSRWRSGAAGAGADHRWGLHVHRLSGGPPERGTAYALRVGSRETVVAYSATPRWTETLLEAARGADLLFASVLLREKR